MEKIIACIDREDDMPSVCDHAVWATLRLGGELEFLHVLDRHPERAPRVDMSGSIGLGAQEALLAELSELDARRSELARERGRLLLETAMARAVEAGALRAEVPGSRARRPSAFQRHGGLVETLGELEAESQLVVMGQHHHGGDLSKRHLDHNLERVVRALHRPLLVAAPTFQAPQQYLIAFDGSAMGRKIVQMAAASPLLRGLPAHVVTVADDSSVVREHLSWAAEQLSAQEIAVTTACVPGEPETALARHAVDHGLELMIMGAYGHSRIRHLLVGSTTTATLRTSPIAILVVR